MGRGSKESTVQEKSETTAAVVGNAKNMTARRRVSDIRHLVILFYLKGQDPKSFISI
jgi:hypothetical protein